MSFRITLGYRRSSRDELRGEILFIGNDEVKIVSFYEDQFNRVAITTENVMARLPNMREPIEFLLEEAASNPGRIFHINQCAWDFEDETDPLKDELGGARGKYQIARPSTTCSRRTP